MTYWCTNFDAHPFVWVLAWLHVSTFRQENIVCIYIHSTAHRKADERQQHLCVKVLQYLQNHADATKTLPGSIMLIRQSSKSPTRTHACTRTHQTCRPHMQSSTSLIYRGFSHLPKTPANQKHHSNHINKKHMTRSLRAMCNTKTFNHKRV